eukprot:TRINITY_DN5763_c0_g1_i1.p1 TRINITY_DN5763_c0_g1~~TRINITY_DN5763_c0_g1_i1.p1  ORF type:complete len:658 (+),score=162.97 TRINITY_DN5763_c0_g1_i1:176-2149(+)
MDNEGDIIEERRSAEGEVTVVRRYQKGPFLGKGGFAKCYEVKDCDTGKTLAAKVIDKTTLNKNRARQKLMSEIRIHKAMGHSSVVHFERYFEDQQRAYILLELCPNQSLKELVKRRKRLHELEAQCYMHQLVSGVKYIHSQKVIHRDLKLGNLFIGRGMELKIGDFGLAAKLDFVGERRRTVCGTPNYIAPEVLSSKLTGHSFEADVWSIGVILYAMLVGKPPFETKEVKATYKRIRVNDYTIPAEAKLSPEAKSLITDILVTNPSLRPSLDSIMEHSFMTKNSIPPNLPKSSLNFSLTEEFISRYQGKDVKEETLRGLSRGSTLNSARKSDILIKEQVRVVHMRHPESQRELDARLATPKGSVFAGTAKGSAKSKTRLTTGQLQLFKQTSKNFMSPTVMTMKKYQPELVKAKLPVQYSTTARSIVTTSTLISKRIPNESTKPPESCLSYVLYYQDYTDKYGVGYILTNGSIGFYYNDMTNMIWLERKGLYGYSDFCSKGEGMVCLTEEQGHVNKDLDKKLRILSHFKRYCLKLGGEGKILRPELPVCGANESEVIVKRVIKTKNGLLLKLTNGAVQTIFIDQSQIVFSAKSKLLIYIDKKGEKESITLANDLMAIENEKIKKKFKYTLGVLNYISNGAVTERKDAVQLVCMFKQSN